MKNIFSLKHKHDWECGGSLGAALYGLAKLMRSEIILEFGTFKGLSALCFAAAIKEDVKKSKIPSSAKVITYDNYDHKKHSAFEKNRYVDFRIGDSIDKKTVRGSYLKYKGRCRIVFFDTKHSYEHTKIEFLNLYDIIDEDTLVLFHDADTGHERHTVHRLLSEISSGYYNTTKNKFSSICIPTRWSDDYCLQKNIKDIYGRGLSDGLGIIRKEIIR